MTSTMLSVLATCCLLFAPVWSAISCDTNPPFSVGDGKLDWTATLNSQEINSFYPNSSEISMNSGNNTLVLSTPTRTYQLKVRQVVIQIKQVSQVSLAGDTQSVPNNQQNDFKTLTFDVNDDVNAMTLDITGSNNQAKIRSISIAGCYDVNAKEINDGLDQFKTRWENGEAVADFIEDFYTSDAVFIEQGQGIRYGPAAIANNIFTPVQAVKPSVDIDVFEAIKLSEVRMLSLHFATFFNATGVADPVRRYMLLWRRDSITGSWMVNRACVNYG